MHSQPAVPIPEFWILPVSSPKQVKRFGIFESRTPHYLPHFGVSSASPAPLRGLLASGQAPIADPARPAPERLPR